MKIKTPIVRPPETLEQKEIRIQRQIEDNICEEHRLFEVARRGESRFPQSSKIAYELYLHRKGR